MNAVPPRSVLFLGDTDAGKTNYIARVWLGVQAGSGPLKSRRLPSNAQYLNAAQAKLLAGEFVGHTPSDVVSDSDIPLVFDDSSGSVDVDLIVPDYPGEQIRRIYKTREWSKEWEERMRLCSAVLLFIRPTSEQVVAPMDWLHASRLWNGSVPDANAHEAGPTPTQVVLVDWFQFLRATFSDLFGSSQRVRLGIVVSAWDSLPQEAQKEAPSRFLDQNYALLGQFLRNNSADFDSQVFGVSIVGGDLDQTADFKTSYLAGDPAEAGYSVVDDGKGRARREDVLAPIAWALGLG